MHEEVTGAKEGRTRRRYRWLPYVIVAILLNFARQVIGDYELSSLWLVAAVVLSLVVCGGFFWVHRRQGSVL